MAVETMMIGMIIAIVAITIWNMRKPEQTGYYPIYNEFG